MTAVANLSVKKIKSLKELVKEVNGKYEEEVDVWEQLERENPDFTFYQDERLESLVETLKFNGMDDKQIVSFSMALYGPVIDFYQVGTNDDKFYVMAVGTR